MSPPRGGWQPVGSLPASRLYETATAGIVEVEEMDLDRCLAIQMPYLGPVKGYYTDWTPLKDRPGLFPEDLDEKDPWQFRNILVR